MDAAKSYDKLADVYDLIFEDWEASIERQSASLSRLISHYGVEKVGQQVLDCACGIGTQTLGLAQRGFEMTSCDISPSAVERARTEASRRNLTIEFIVADMRDLTKLGNRRFDAVISMDNSLPHLTTDEELRSAATQIHSKLRAGGVFISSIRDYDSLLIQRPQVQGPSFYGEAENRRIVLQVWDWIDEFRYCFHLYITRRIAGEWETFHTSAIYRAFPKDELAAVLREVGFVDMTWIPPAESGWYQPVLIARARQAV